MSSPIIEHLLRHARDRTDQPAIVEERRQATFGELAELAKQWAGQLDRRGVGPGDTVLVYVPPSIELYGLLLGLWWRGAVAVFADAWTTRNRLAQVTKLVEPSLFVGIRKAQLLRWINPVLRRVPSQGPGRPRGKRPEVQQARVDLDDTALVTFTTGSTGAPKGADRTHGFLMTQHKTLIDALGEAPDGPDLTTLPVFVLHALAAGRTSLIAPIPPGSPAGHRPERLYRFMKSHRPASTAASPAVLERLLDHMEARALTWPGDIDVHVGGAAVLPHLMQRMRRSFPLARLTAVYGSTEVEPIALKDGDALADTPVQDCRTGLPVGIPYHGVDLRIMSVHLPPRAHWTEAQWSASRTAPGEAGEIYVAGDHVLKRYYRAPPQVVRENKVRVDDVIWHRTGDAGRLDQTGELRLLGRVGQSFVIDSGRFFPLPYEMALKALAGVRNAALIPGNLRPVVCIEPYPHARGNFRSAVEALNLPFSFDFWLGAIPRDPRHNSKVDVARLHALVTP
jgi:acyl-CoA synthetase (AMP-forming)/AMP-acid ligase II